MKPNKPAASEVPIRLSTSNLSRSIFCGCSASSARSTCCSTLASTVLKVSWRSRRAPSSSSSIWAICSSSGVIFDPHRRAEQITEQAGFAQPLAHRYLHQQPEDRQSTGAFRPAAENEPGCRCYREAGDRLFHHSLGKSSLI